jgi:diguanylate cyclase (GGDEF)-like protein
MAENRTLQRYLSPLGVWALSFGCSVGWGSFVMPGTTFLPIAGPIGTAIGIAIGALIMLIIGRNYYFLMNRHPDAGGTYTYAKRLLGYDHGFLSGWFLVLTYIVIVWANLTALALIGRRLLGDMFQFGFHYTLAGYDVYFGEVLTTIGVLAVCCAICVFRKRFAVWVQILMAVILFGGIVTCFVVASVRNSTSVTYTPAFSTLSESGSGMQLVGIVALAPWAYVGFESASHSAEEFRFRRSKTFLILFISVLTAGIAYVLLSLLASTAHPEGYANWAEYVADLDNLSGYESLPTFFAVNRAMGSVGMVILGVTVLGGIITGIIGNTIAASRVLYSMAKDEVLPRWFAKLNRDSNPSNAILFIMLISIVIPFFGRTAISWIVDVTTVGATIIYCYTSVAALKEARHFKNRWVTVTGAAGIAISVIFALYFLIPNLSSVSTLATESYLILTLWSIFGLLFFRHVFGKDSTRRFGKSIVVWIVLLVLILFVSIMWMQQANNRAIEQTQDNISSMYSSEFDAYNIRQSAEEKAEIHDFVEKQMDTLNRTLLVNNLIRIVLIMTAITIIFTVYQLMNKRQREFENMQTMAYKDALTGVENKHAYARMEQHLNDEITAGTTEPFALVVCDLNGLKAINDNKGHSAGDDYIRESCAIICDIFAHSPVYRIGGDEFVVLLKNRDYEIRELLINQLRDNIGVNIEVGAAIIASGMSEFNSDDDRCVADVFARADSAMYINKKELKAMR